MRIISVYAYNILCSSVAYAIFLEARNYVLRTFYILRIIHKTTSESSLTQWKMVADIYMLNKNTWGVKKGGANQKQHCKQAGVTKTFDISWGQEVTLSNICNSLNDTQYYSIFSQVWLALSPFIIVYRYEKRWPSDKANHTCENML